MAKTILFKSESPKQPMTRPYYWALIHRVSDKKSGQKTIQSVSYNVCQMFTDDIGGQGNGFYTQSFADALTFFHTKVVRDLLFFSTEWERSLSELNIQV